MPNLNLPINNLLSPWSIALVTLFVLFLILTLTPTLAARANAGVHAVRRRFFRAATSALESIKDQWMLIGQEKQRGKTKAKLQLQAENKQLKDDGKPPLTPEKNDERLKVLEKLYSNSENLGGGVIAQAWFRRFFYLILVLVCAFSDYVLVSTRAPILFGGGKTPEWLVMIYSYLQLITGALFVSVAGLSGMLFDEYVQASLPDAVRIDPEIPEWFRRTKLIASGAMFVLDIVVIIILTLLGVAQQYSQATYVEEFYAVFIGASLLIAIGIFLAWSGLVQALTGLGWLIFGSVFALICAILGLVFLLFEGICAALAALHLAIFGRGAQGNDAQPVIDKRTLAIIGYKGGGSDFAVQVCEQISQLYSKFVWLAGYYAPENDAELRRRLLRSSVTEHTIVADSGEHDGARALTDTLKGYYVDKPDVVKPLLWIVQDDELGDCLEALRDFEKAPGISNVELMLVWLVSGRPDKTRKDLAQRLNNWASGPSAADGKLTGDSKAEDSKAEEDDKAAFRKPPMLATTLVIENASPLNKRAGAETDAILARSVASLVVPDTLTRRSSFADELAELRAGNSHFASLAAGSIGVISALQNFKDGSITGQAGQINPIQASATLEILANDALKQNLFETVNDTPLPKPSRKPTSAPAPNTPASNAATPANDAATNDPASPAANAPDPMAKWKQEMAKWEQQQERVFVHLAAPTRLRLLKAYKGLVSEWLQDKYGVSQDHVSVTRSYRQSDHGVDISIPIPEWQAPRRAPYYLHFTALRGVGAEGTEMPTDLKS